MPCLLLLPRMNPLTRLSAISEVLIDLAAGAPKKVHSGSIDRVYVERAITTPGTSTAQEDSDNIAKTLTMTTHSEDVSCETLFTERNPRRQENPGDGDAEARPKAPSSSKDSTTVDEDRLKLHNMELTARVAMLEAEVSKLRHQVSMHETHQCPTVPTPSLVSVGTQTDTSLFTDATKKGEVVNKEDDADSLEEWIQEQTVFQSPLYKPAFVQIHDLPDSVDEEEDVTEGWKLVVRAVDEVLQEETLHEDTPPSFSILPEAAAIISHSSTPQLFLILKKLEFDSILAWGYDGIAKRFWIGWEFSGVEELKWNSLNALQVLNMYLTKCINTSSDLSAELAISRFYDLMEDNMPWFERLLKEANRVAHPESSSAAEQRLAPRRLDIIRSSALTEEEVICWRRFLYNIMVRDVKGQGWISTDSHDFTFFLSNGSPLSINIKEILLLPSAFMHKVFELRSLIFNVNSLESQEMIKIIKASLYKEESGSDSDLSFFSSPTVRLNTEEESKRRDKEKMKEAWKEVTGMEWKEDEESSLPLSIPQNANEAEAEIPTASTTSAVVVHEAEAEASNKDKGKGLMTKEDEERIEKKKKEKEDRRRRREE
ncbi:hypothetical protein L1987_15255 [Smallanthus sonchifolius]|uniref:Uncharacterized protein n=1 Tax=Smallanthus sonchifolius TaxID=185202 RepID=A0ACB9J7E0_9ASTR|nr:hypothetical protein L1987_15255 [Smallanthus sonchifolius]